MAETATPTAARPGRGARARRRAAVPAPAPHANPNKGLYPPRHPGRSSRMIGEVVVDLGFADRETVEDAVQAAREQGRPTGLILVERGILRHDQLARVVAERFGLDFVDLTTFDLDMGAVNLISAETARRYQAVPVGFTEDGAAAGGDGQPHQRPHDRRHRDDDRPARAPRGRLDRGPRPAAGRARRGWTSRSKTSSTRRRRTSAEDLRLTRPTTRRPVIKLVHSIVAQADPAGRLRHPHQPRGGRHARDVPRRRRAHAGRHRQAQDGRRGRLAHQDHGRPRHLRAPRAPGRPLRADRRRAPGRHPRGHAAARLRRGRRDAHPRQRRLGRRDGRRSGCRTRSKSASNAPSTGPTAPCS